MASSETAPVAKRRSSRIWDTSRRASSVRTRHQGPGVGRHQAFGVKELGSPPQGKQTLKLSPSTGSNGCSSDS